MTNERQENTGWIARKPLRLWKNKKAYDRFRDRKDKKIYEEQLELLEEDNNETDS